MASPKWTEQPNQKSVSPKEVYGLATVREGVPLRDCCSEFVTMRLGGVCAGTPPTRRVAVLPTEKEL